MKNNNLTSSSIWGIPTEEQVSFWSRTNEDRRASLLMPYVPISELEDRPNNQRQLVRGIKRHLSRADLNNWSFVPWTSESSDIRQRGTEADRIYCGTEEAFVFMFTLELMQWKPYLNASSDIVGRTISKVLYTGGVK